MDPILGKALWHITDNKQHIQEYVSIPDLAAIISDYSLSALDFERVLLEHSHTLRIDGGMQRNEWLNVVVPCMQAEYVQNARLQQWVGLNLSTRENLASALRNAFVTTNEPGCQRNFCYYAENGCNCSSPVTFPVECCG